jgi:hypothetical protein
MAFINKVRGHREIVIAQNKITLAPFRKGGIVLKQQETYPLWL